MTPNKKLWAGRIISGLMVAFLLFDSSVKLMRLPGAVEATVRLGYPARLLPSLGITELTCVVLYVIPRTSILGAILLTGYLGGATATKCASRIHGSSFRLSSPRSFGEGSICATSGCAHLFHYELSRPI